MKLLIRNGWVVNPDARPEKRDIYIENGKIAEVAEGFGPNAEADVIDAQGQYVIPGLIDMSCRVGEPGYEYQEDIASASKAAARGGFTSITYQPGTKPVIDNKTVVDYVTLKARALSFVNIYLYGSMTLGMEGEKLAEIGEMLKAGIVAVSDGGKSIQNSYLMRKILLYTSMFGIPVITMCEDSALAAGGVANRGLVSTKTGLLGIPREAEEVMVARNVLIAKHNNARLHITHVTTEGSVKLIREAKQSGLAVTCDTCPHYFSLSENVVESYNTYGKVKPPLRTERDLEIIREGLSDGTIDVIASGHTPCTIEYKRKEFDRAAFGISALDTALAASYTELVLKKHLTLGQLVTKMSKNPADILGLSGKGEIKPGMDADIVVLSDKDAFAVRAAEFASKAKFSPFEGRELLGEVKHTVVNGKIVCIK